MLFSLVHPNSFNIVVSAHVVTRSCGGFSNLFSGVFHGIKIAATSARDVDLPVPISATLPTIIS